MVHLRTQNICINRLVRNYHNFWHKNVLFSRPIFVLLCTDPYHQSCTKNSLSHWKSTGTLYIPQNLHLIKEYMFVISEHSISHENENGNAKDNSTYENSYWDAEHNFTYEYDYGDAEHNFQDVFSYEYDYGNNGNMESETDYWDEYNKNNHVVSTEHVVVDGHHASLAEIKDIDRKLYNEYGYLEQIYCLKYCEDLERQCYSATYNPFTGKCSIYAQSTMYSYRITTLYDLLAYFRICDTSKSGFFFILHISLSLHWA